MMSVFNCTNVSRGVVPPWPRYGGGRMNQLMVQVDGGGSRLCGVEGESLVEVMERWKGAGGLWSAPLWQKGAPLWGRARPCCLLGRQGFKPFQEVW